MTVRLKSLIIKLERSIINLKIWTIQSLHELLYKRMKEFNIEQLPFINLYDENFCIINASQASEKNHTNQ